MGLRVGSGRRTEAAVSGKVGFLTHLGSHKSGRGGRGAWHEGGELGSGAGGLPTVSLLVTAGPEYDCRARRGIPGAVSLQAAHGC